MKLIILAEGNNASLSVTSQKTPYLCRDIRNNTKGGDKFPGIIPAPLILYLFRRATHIVSHFLRFSCEVLY